MISSKRGITAPVLIIFLIAYIQGFCQPAVNFIQSIPFESQNFFKEKMAAQNIVGLSVAVIVDDSVIFKQGFGYSDKENQVPMTTSSVVNIGSITKTFTALAVMQLQQKGLVNINDPLRNYLPSFRPKTNGIDINPVTVKSVVTHSSGIQPDIWKNSDLSSAKYTDVLNYVNETYLAYPPGMTGLYSNAGYNILGRLIKEVSRLDYPDYVHQFIFNPLGMTQSGFAMDSLKNRTKIYLGGSRVEEYELRDIASGGIYMNIEDFAKYAKGLIDAYHNKSSSLIDPATFKTMCRLQNANVPIETNKKGLGWFMFRNDSAFALYHAGSAGFAQAKILLLPKEKAAVMVLTNSAEGNSVAEDYCFNFLPKFGLGIPDLFPPPVTGKIHAAKDSIRVPINLLQKHVAHYGQPYSYISVRIDHKRLVLTDGNQQFALKPLGENEFLAYEIISNDSSIETNKRYIFKNIGSYHFLFLRTGDREYQLGSKLPVVKSSEWKKWFGIYSHFGYQMKIGDTKFKEAEIYQDDHKVLILKLTTFGSIRTIPLYVISGNQVLTSGINGGFGGYNIHLSETGGEQVLDFAGITFKKKKTG